MTISYQVFKLVKVQGAVSTNNDPFGLFPVKVESESYTERRGVFLTESAAIDYINSLGGAHGAHTIVKIYGD